MAKVNEYYPTHIEEYSEKYKEWIKFKLEDNILEMRFHTDDGPLKWSCAAQAAIERACYDINHDPEVECVIITGTDDYFMSGNLMPEDPRAGTGWPADYFSPWATHDYWYHAQTLEPIAVLGLQMPVIAAINGPQHQHPELTLTADIVICSDNTFFKEFHYQNGSVPPGDDTWPIWRTLIGHNRARYMMYMGGIVNAQQAYDWGVVSEVMPLDKLNARAWEIARQLMKQPRYCRRLTRGYLNGYWRELFAKELNSGLAHEGFAAVCDSRIWPEDKVKQDYINDADGSRYQN